MSSEHDDFWSRVDRSRGPSECWPWTASVSGTGYGQLRLEGRRASAHRTAYALVHGDPGHLCVCHHCDNRPCCNPGHLFLGTRADNNHDMHAKGRNRQPKGSSSKGAKLTEEQVESYRARYAFGAHPADLAAEAGVAVATMRAALSGRDWGHTGGVVPMRWARARLSNEQAIEVAASSASSRSLAEKFGVPQYIIRRIRQGVSYRNIVGARDAA